MVTGAAAAVVMVVVVAAAAATTTTTEAAAVVVAAVTAAAVLACGLRVHFGKYVSVLTEDRSLCRLCPRSSFRSSLQPHVDRVASYSSPLAQGGLDGSKHLI